MKGGGLQVTSRTRSFPPPALSKLTLIFLGPTLVAPSFFLLSAIFFSCKGCASPPRSFLYSRFCFFTFSLTPFSLVLLRHLPLLFGRLPSRSRLYPAGEIASSRDVFLPHENLGFLFPDSSFCSLSSPPFGPAGSLFFVSRLWSTTSFFVKTTVRLPPPWAHPLIQSCFHPPSRFPATLSTCLLRNQELTEFSPPPCSLLRGPPPPPPPPPPPTPNLTLRFFFVRLFQVAAFFPLRRNDSPASQPPLPPNVSMNYLFPFFPLTRTIFFKPSLLTISSLFSLLPDLAPCTYVLLFPIPPDPD